MLSIGHGFFAAEIFFCFFRVAIGDRTKALRNTVRGITVFLLDQTFDGGDIAFGFFQLVTGQIRPCFANFTFELIPFAFEDVSVQFLPPGKTLTVELQVLCTEKWGGLGSIFLRHALEKVTLKE